MFGPYCTDSFNRESLCPSRRPIVRSEWDLGTTRSPEDDETAWWQRSSLISKSTAPSPLTPHTRKNNKKCEIWWSSKRLLRLRVLSVMEKGKRFWRPHYGCTNLPVYLKSAVKAKTRKRSNWAEVKVLNAAIKHCRHHHFGEATKSGESQYI